jgi:hypothetical protein
MVPSGSRARWRRKAGFVLCLCALAVFSIGGSNGSASQVSLVQPSVLNEGRFAGYYWKVTVNDDGRKSICMLVSILRRSGLGPGESAQCSAPSLRRGNVRSLFVHKQSGGIALTVFGGAFDAKIVKVQVVMLDGKVKDLPFRRPRPGGGSRHLGRFRYVAMAVHGPWCVRELITRDAAGSAMWRAGAGELLSYSAVAQCRQPGKR